MAGIYVHVPFCHAKCAYCDFYSIANSRFVDDYISAVEKEYSLRCGETGGQCVETLYFGGGTPSMLSAEQFGALAKVFPRAGVKEFTIEVNPEDVTPGIIDVWMREGVNRVSIGVQSLNDDELKAVNRRHSSADALAAIDTIKQGGIDNISADLIYGLPGQTDRTWQDSLKRLLDSGIKHLSAYCLSFEEGTLLYRRLQQGRVEEASDEEIEKRYGLLCRIAAEHGFEHYEISNFALPGFRSRHNSSYWRSVPYLGLGPAAHSLGADGCRRFNVGDVRQYIAGPQTATTVDEETPADRLNDMIMIGLRTAEGLNRDNFTPQQWKALLGRGRHWQDAGVLMPSSDGQRLFIPEDRWLVADAVIRDLFE